MTDILDRLAARHGTVRSRKPSCPRCNARPAAARLRIAVTRTRPKEGRKADETVVSAVRTMCADCTVEVFEQIIAELPDREHSDGGHP